MTRAASATPDASRESDHYFVQSQQPLHALIFLAPLVVAYELGALLYVAPYTGEGLKARTWIQQFLEMFGAVGQYLPGVAVVVVLLTWHVVARHRWRVGPPSLYLSMAAESAALALPVLVFALLVLGRPVASDRPWQVEAVFSVGAGVYEELVFRMMGIALIHGLVVDVMKLGERAGAVSAIVITSLCFAAAHYPEGSGMAWAAFVRSPRFFFCVISGAFFAAVYVLRGFGIAAAAHAGYDLIVTALAYQGVSGADQG